MKRIGILRLDAEAEYLRMLVYGEPGSGKTWFGASACLTEEARPVLYLDYRGQVTSLRGHPDYATAIENGNLFLARLGAYKDLNHIYTWMVGKDVPNLDKAWPHEGRPKTLVLDSVTELQRLEVMRRAGNEPDTFMRDLERPTIRDWGSLLDQFVLLGRLFYDLQCHVIFTALERTDFNDKDQAIGHKIAMHGQAAKQLPAYALTVMRLTQAPRGAADTFNVGYTVGHQSASKDQTGRLPAQIANPTVAKILWALAKGGTTET